LSETCSGATFSWPEIWYFHDLAESRFIGVVHQVIEAYAASDKHFLNSRKIAQAAQQF